VQREGVKRLLLLRHAEAEAAHPNAPAAANDFDRALTAHGRAQALQAGHRLRHERLLPDLMLVSPALRARETARIVAAYLECLSTLRYEPEGYPGTPATWLQRVRQIGPSIGTLLLVGHNPGLSDLARRLVAPTSSRGGAASDSTELPDLPTAGLLSFGFTDGWSVVGTTPVASVSWLA
jgi:phosphohistidine phosphatase